MATESLLAIDDLLAPIPGDHPAGEPVPFAIRSKLDEDRKEINPEDFDANDPLRPTEPKRADWRSILREATAGLTTTSKDLLLGARITEAATRINGFAGLAEGLALLRRLLDECWDRLHPGIEDGDLEVRAGQFNWLGDDGRGGRFPHTVRTVPLFPLDGEWVTLHDVRQSQDNKGRFKREQIDKAANDASREHCQALVDGINASIREMEQLLAVLNSRLGSSAPALIDLRKVMGDALALASQVLQRKGPAPSQATEEVAHESNGAVVPAKAVDTRESVYTRLSELADTLARIEPHSPVPYLVRRAVALGMLPFPQMMRELIRTDYTAALDEMNRELGIKDEPAA